MVLRYSNVSVSHNFVSELELGFDPTNEMHSLHVLSSGV